MADLLAGLTGVKALTLRNPWAHYVAHYGKNIENREWMPPEGVDRFLVHAGAGWDKPDPRYVPPGDLGNPHTSAFVALVDLAFACDASRWSSELRCPCNPDWAMPGQCHWNLINVVALPEPVPYPRGWLGLWRPAPAALEAVTEQLRTLANAQAPA